MRIEINSSSKGVWMLKFKSYFLDRLQFVHEHNFVGGCGLEVEQVVH